MSGEAVGGIDVARGGAQLRLVGDVANRARLSAAAVERALWTLEDFDALHVDQVGVVIACRELHRLVIEIQGHVRKWRRRRLRLVARADSPQPAHEDIAGARAVAAEGHVGRVLQQVVERHYVQLRQLIAGDRLDRDRYVLQVLGAALRGDHHLGQLTPGGGGGFGRRGKHERRARRPQYCRHRRRDLRIRLHRCPLRVGCVIPTTRASRLPKRAPHDLYTTRPDARLNKSVIRLHSPVSRHSASRWCTRLSCVSNTRLGASRAHSGARSHAPRLPASSPRAALRGPSQGSKLRHWSSPSR